jgi:hypothetical protein
VNGATIVGRITDAGAGKISVIRGRGD